jgi:hypothetical protein
MAFFHANVHEAMLREPDPARKTDDPAGIRLWRGADAAG